MGRFDNKIQAAEEERQKKLAENPIAKSLGGLKGKKELESTETVTEEVTTQAVAKQETPSEKEESRAVAETPTEETKEESKVEKKTTKTKKEKSTSNEGSTPRYITEMKNNAQKLSRKGGRSHTFYMQDTTYDLLAEKAAELDIKPSQLLQTIINETLSKW